MLNFQDGTMKFEVTNNRMIGIDHIINTNNTKLRFILTANINRFNYPITYYCVPRLRFLWSYNKNDFIRPIKYFRTQYKLEVVSSITIITNIGDITIPLKPELYNISDYLPTWDETTRDIILESIYPHQTINYRKKFSRCYNNYKFNCFCNYLSSDIWFEPTCFNRTFKEGIIRELIETMYDNKPHCFNYGLNEDVYKLLIFELSNLDPEYYSKYMIPQFEKTNDELKRLIEDDDFETYKKPNRIL